MRELLGSRELNAIEQKDMDNIKELMVIVNSGPHFTQQAKDAFVKASVESGAVEAMVHKYILTEEERLGLLQALEALVGSLASA
jgi:S-adenosylhomocysteine hydrolase